MLSDIDIIVRAPRSVTDAVLAAKHNLDPYIMSPTSYDVSVSLSKGEVIVEVSTHDSVEGYLYVYKKPKDIDGKNVTHQSDFMKTIPILKYRNRLVDLSLVSYEIRVNPPILNYTDDRKNTYSNGGFENDLQLSRYPMSSISIQINASIQYLYKYNDHPIRRWWCQQNSQMFLSDSKKCSTYARKRRRRELETCTCHRGLHRPLAIVSRLPERSRNSSVPAVGRSPCDARYSSL